MTGRLIFVGLGIKAISQVTLEAQSWIKNSDLVIHHLVDPLTEHWINSLNSCNFSLNPLYQYDQPRLVTYKKMVKTILSHVDQGKTVCVALYGNPGFYVYATHRAAAIGRKKGHYVEINPGISSLDCLLTDLDIDIVNNGLQILEATTLILHHKKIDTSCYVVIMQPGPVGEQNYKGAAINEKHLLLLKEHLIKVYGENFQVILYSAAVYAVTKPIIKRCRLKNLEKNLDIYLSTICIPPK